MILLRMAKLFLDGIAEGLWLLVYRLYWGRWPD